MRLIATAMVFCLLLMMSTSALAQNVNLTMYYPVAVGGPITKIIDDMIADFQKDNPGITVQAVYAGNYDDTRTKALAALNAGEPVQLSVLFSIDVFDLMDQDVIVPFNDLVATDEERQWMGSFYPALMENSTVDGKVYGIPFQRSTIVMYYNKDAFRDAGLDPESPPATWDEMVEAAKKLTKRDASGNVTQWGVHVPSSGYPYWMFQAFAMQNNQVLMSGDGTEVYFDHPAVVESLEFWRDLSHTHDVMPRGVIDWGTLRQKFLEGSTAMMWHTTGNLTPVRNEARFDFGVAMLPAKQRRGSPTGGGNFYVFKQASAEERKAALQFIRWMTSPERAADWSIATGYVGVRPDAYITPALSEYVEGFSAAAVARDQLEYATAEFSTYETARVKKFLDDAIQSVLTGQAQPAQALQGAQAAAERVLRAYK
ncbi:ABC transporter substrate-binding protein [Desulfonatronum sp. SC1]|uniref:ABC transporter substrate-binding protein n=1 Tax=Desulfonatronum sp. SC1 TaxID=2109626 RepID=UPI000D2F5840|nr:ABC transporter substrate-binding protein [Desulfonatronum sp. SC1]PTN38463.1 ABC transporter substrate-binding protein [Desulfonatronum sp. SC1]